MTIKVVIADDQALVRGGFAVMVRAAPGSQSGQSISMPRAALMSPRSRTAFEWRGLAASMRTLPCGESADGEPSLIRNETAIHRCFLN